MFFLHPRCCQIGMSLHIQRKSQPSRAFLGAYLLLNVYSIHTAGILASFITTTPPPSQTGGGPSSSSSVSILLDGALVSSGATLLFSFFLLRSLLLHIFLAHLGGLVHGVSHLNYDDGDGIKSAVRMLLLPLPQSGLFRGEKLHNELRNPMRNFVTKA